MSSFATAFGACGRPGLLAEFGETVTYTNSEGTTSDVIAVVTVTSDAEEQFDGGRVMVKRAEFQVSSADVTSPQSNETFTRSDSTVWTIEDPRPVAGGMYSIMTRRVERLEVSGPGFRERWG